MDDSEQKPKGMLGRLADRRRARLAADSAMSFRKFAARMSIVVASLFIDGLIIPSAFQAFGLLTKAFALPIALVLLLAVALELELIRRIK